MTEIRHDDDPGAGAGYDESLASGLDLTPRTGPAAGGPARARKRRPVAVYAILAVVVAGIGFVVLQGLSNATLYFRNVDEALAERDSLGDRKFRLQGLVDEGVAREGDELTFSVSFNDATIEVRHVGAEPADLFAAGQPVVLEGHFEEGSNRFVSERILVKHDEDYREENQDRIADAEDGETE